MSKWIIISSHVTCPRHEIAKEMIILVLNINHSLTIMLCMFLLFFILYLKKVKLNIALFMVDKQC